MHSKNHRKHKVFEFLTLLTTVIGIVIGTGEFVKNDDLSAGHILYATNNNAIMAVLIWVIMGIACIFMMLAFLEVSSSTSKVGNGTTSNWIRIFISRRLASFVSLFWIFLYVPIFYTFFSIATTEYFFQSFKNIQEPIYSAKYIIIYYAVGLFILTFFTMLNTFLPKYGKFLQIIGTFAKFIPFLLILILSFVHPANPNTFNNDNNHLWKTSSFFMATGPVLFSFDGFVFAGNLQKETNNKHLVYPALLFGIVIVVIVYILEAVALFVGTNDGSVMSLFQNNFSASPQVASAFQLLIVFAIVIGMNGNSIVGSRYIQTDTKEKLLYNFNRKVNFRVSGIIQALIALFWFLLLLTLGIFINHGNFDGSFQPFHFSDLMSNVVVMFAFLVYITVMLGAVVNRFTKKVKITKVRGMPYFAVSSALILTISIFYSFYLSFFVQTDITKYLILGSILLNFTLFLSNEYLMKKQNKNINYNLKL